MKKGYLILLSGSSGSGKGSLKLLITADAALNAKSIISFTTRNPRKFESEDKDYFFISQEEFNEIKNKGEFLEYTTYEDYSYGTKKKDVDSLLNQGINVVIETDINGAKMVLNNYDDENVISFFVLPPSLQAVKKRLERHSFEDSQSIGLKLYDVMDELNKLHVYDYIVCNDILQNLADEIRTTLLKLIQQGGKAKDQPKGIKIPEDFEFKLN